MPRPIAAGNREILPQGILPQAVLPPEIAFLARHGIRPETLREGARIARQTGVSGEAALLRTRLVPEATFYAALARELDLPFLSDVVAVHPLARFPESILAGILPLKAETGAIPVALAPQGEDLCRILAHRPTRREGLAIIAPARLRECVTAMRSVQIAERAENELIRVAPQESYRGGLSNGQLVGIGCLLACLAGALAVAPRESGLGLAITAGLFFLGQVALRLAAARERAPVEPPSPYPRRDSRGLPVYTVLVPLYREGRVLKRLVAALEALDYPRVKLDIKLLVEADDRPMRDAIARTRLPPHIEVIVAPSGQIRTKPRALNIGLPLARGDYVVVYDAEDIPDPAQLRLAVEIFAAGGPDLACLQARLAIDNTEDGILTRLFTIEYAALFDVINPGLCRFNLPLPLGGTSNHLRTEVLRQLGGWDAWNVTEDADLGMRLAIAGYGVMDLPSTTIEEAPARLGAWMRQRTRWMKGFLQVSITYTRRPLWCVKRLGLERALAAAMLIPGAFGAALAFPPMTLFAAYQMAEGSWLRPADMLELAAAALSLTVFSAGIAALFVPAAVALHRRRLGSLLPYIGLLPLYYVLVSAAAWLSLVEILRAPFRWNKTEHGLARTSRSGLLTGSGPSPSRPPPASARD